MWGHFFETHDTATHVLLEKGFIEEGHLTEPFYTDARIELYDQKVLKRILDMLNDFGLYDDTTIILMSDHGANYGEHQVDPLEYMGGQTFPQHRDLYEHTTRVCCVIKDKSVPKNVKVKGMVRSIDVFPTLIKMLGINSDIKTEGVNLLPFVEKKKAEGLIAYIEELYEKRGGAKQAVRTDNYKYMRNLTKGVEEFYDVRKDPAEQVNLINEKSLAQEITKLRGICNRHILPKTQYSPEISEKEKKMVEARLRDLGYIDN